MPKIIYQIKQTLKKILPKSLLSGYHFCLAFLAALFYGFPSRKLKVLAVTGTSGKTTVVAMVTAILEQAGFGVASLSSIRFKIAGQEQLNTKRMTLPGRFFVQQFLRKAVKAGCQYAVLEITSEGIVQHRHRFINFEAAVFTNLSLEHIESHGSFEKYRQAKGDLFKTVKNIHILNLDDENVGYFTEFEAKEKWGFGIKISNFQLPCLAGRQAITNQIPTQKFKIIKAEDIKSLIDGSEFTVNLPGEFNVYNALAAIAVARSQHIDLGICQKALTNFRGVPGRMEQVISSPYKVFVDYAITPNALEKVYQTLTKNYKLKTNKLVCVFGACGGGRDKWKRPILGQIAAKYCHQIILTNEDPYDENPGQILSMIKSGISKSQIPIPNLYEIIDRREAINKAINLAQQGDIVVITGKGCEPSICLANGRQIPWDDCQVVREEFDKLHVKYPTFGTIVKNVVYESEKRYEILEHIADIKIRVFGKIKEELFENAMLGMFAAADYEPDSTASLTGREIEIKSVDFPALLVDFLSKIVYLCETEKEVYESINFRHLSEKRLAGQLSGRKTKKRGVQIKGVTYHNLQIVQKGDQWRAEILFDV